MTYEKLFEILQSTDIPFRYHHFNKEKEPPPVPRGVYMFKDADSIFADGVTAMLIDNIRIELYTATKDPEIEKKLETVLTSAEIPFEKVDEVYIESENMYMIVYEI